MRRGQKENGTGNRGLLHWSLVTASSLFGHPRVIVRPRGSLLCVTYRMGGFHRTLLFLSFQFG